VKEHIAQLLQEFREGVEYIYGFRLYGVYLYGSYARGEADAESDIDILVVLEDFAHYGSEVDRTGQLGADLSLKYGVSISQVFMREHDWLQGETPFLANVREEAVPA
jgi:predicted nucleotidyltransferase